MYNIRYRANPELYRNLSYENFLNETIKAVKKVNNPNFIKLDNY